MPDLVTTGVPRPTRHEPAALSTLAAGCGGRLDGDDLSVTGVTGASAFVRPGDLFAALPGRSGHGARFAGAAHEAGAVAVLTDPAGRELIGSGVATIVVVDDVRAVLGRVSADVYGRPSSRLNLLGVTGTSGKTTTTFLMRAGLAAQGRTTGLIGTVATMIGDDEIETGFTTPEAPETQALLALMHERGVTDLAMEVSSHALAMGRVGGLRFRAAGFTNLSEDHLDFHPTMDDYFAAKLTLLDPARGYTDRPVVVSDSEWGARMAAAVGRPVTVSTQGDDTATWRAEGIEVGADATTTFRVLGPGFDLRAGCAIPGRYNVANVVLALAMLHEGGADVVAAAEAIARAQVPGRMERIDTDRPFLAVVDYSHKPAAVDGALQALRPLTRGRLIVVLGCGGDRDRGKRPHMGEIAARGADLLIVTDDNPRSEDPAAIRRAMLDGALAVPTSERGEVSEIGDRAAAIAHAVSVARAGDTVLIAGKGHEKGQEIAGVKHPFDDREVLHAALAGAS